MRIQKAEVTLAPHEAPCAGWPTGTPPGRMGPRWCAAAVYIAMSVLADDCGLAPMNATPPALHRVVIVTTELSVELSKDGDAHNSSAAMRNVTLSMRGAEHTDQPLAYMFGELPTWLSMTTREGELAAPASGGGMAPQAWLAEVPLIFSPLGLQESVEPYVADVNLTVFASEVVSTIVRVQLRVRARTEASETLVQQLVINVNANETNEVEDQDVSAIPEHVPPTVCRSSHTYFCARSRSRKGHQRLRGLPAHRGNTRRPRRSQAGHWAAVGSYRDLPSQVDMTVGIPLPLVLQVRTCARDQPAGSAMGKVAPTRAEALPPESRRSGNSQICERPMP